MSIVLYGAGAAGRYALKHLQERGETVISFADNAHSKWNTEIEGIPVRPVGLCSTTATWVATAISRPAANEIRSHIKEMGVLERPLWDCLTVCHGLMPESAYEALMSIVEDVNSRVEIIDQLGFRKSGSYENQDNPSDVSEIYFPQFIKHLDNEHFADCGACDGDTVTAFIRRWEKFSHITALEPDPSNYQALKKNYGDDSRVNCVPWAVGDSQGTRTFIASGDYASHFGDGGVTVSCKTLDGLSYEKFSTYGGMPSPPTYLKMDIEGAELEALWGARKLIKEHSPVLAICAYHTSDHLWQIPLLIHAIQPDYKLFFRRYAEGAFELVWYAVPPERVL